MRNRATFHSNGSIVVYVTRTCTSQGSVGTLNPPDEKLDSIKEVRGRAE